MWLKRFSLTLFIMNIDMLRLSNNNKIFRTIIVFNTIYMVNNFVRQQTPTQLTLCYQSMLFYVKIGWNRIGMISSKNKYIPLGINHSPTCPSMAFFSKLVMARGTRLGAIHKMLMTCYKCLSTIKTRFLIINLLPPSFCSNWGIPNSWFGILPNVFNFTYFHEYRYYTKYLFKIQ